MQLYRRFRRYPIISRTVLCGAKIYSSLRRIANYTCYKGGYNILREIMVIEILFITEDKAKSQGGNPGQSCERS